MNRWNKFETLRFLVFVLISLCNGQIAEYYLPDGAIESTAVAIYSFVSNPENSQEFLMDLRVTANKWVGIGFAGSSGTIDTNLYMNDTYAWIFANFDHGIFPNVLEGTVKEYHLGYHSVGSTVWPPQITVRDSYSYVSGSDILHSIQILRNYDVTRAYSIPQTGNLCFIYAIGNEWKWQNQYTTPDHTINGYVCHDQGGNTNNPTQKPTYFPSRKPTNFPTIKPTGFPTVNGGTSPPTKNPIKQPTGIPSSTPSMIPSSTPSLTPTMVNETRSPSPTPTINPTFEPTKKPTVPTANQATLNPTSNPTISGIIVSTQDPASGLGNGGTFQLWQQILLITAAFILLLICCFFAIFWYFGKRRVARQEKLEKRKKLEEKFKKEAEIFVADNPNAIGATGHHNANVGGGTSSNTTGNKKKISKYADSDYDSFSGDAGTDEELRNKYGKYMDSDDSDDSYLAAKAFKDNKNIQSVSEDDDDDDDDSDSDVQYKKKANKFKFATVKSEKKIIKNQRNKYSDDSE